MWGQVEVNSEKPPVGRIIPTRVGTSCSAVCVRCTIWDHPHACGDKLQVKGSTAQAIGSSPRVWGQVTVVKHLSTKQRIIPTRVGTRSANRANLEEKKDHPHACGDKQQMIESEYILRGSSPRVWGQGKRVALGYLSVRIIPTRVGTSFLQFADLACGQDHPHACGDKQHS